MTLRPIKDIIQEFINAISFGGSGLSIDTTEGSFTYTQARALASAISDVERRISEVENYSLITTAKGVFLDNIGKDFIARESEVRAKGFVLVQSLGEIRTIPANTIFVNLSNAEQYRTLTSIATSDLFETQCPVEALEAGSSGNSLAGQLLFCPNIPLLKVVVGQQRQAERPFGDIIGGRDKETDADYRARLQKHLFNASSLSSSLLATNDFIRSKLLEYPLVERAYVKTLFPGSVEIWVDSSTIYTQNQIEELLTYTRQFLPPDCIPLLAQAFRKVVNFEIDVLPFRASTLSLDSLTAQLKQALQQAVNTLSVGEPLIISDVHSSLTPFVRSVSVKPTQNVVIQPNEIIVVGTLQVKYPA